MKGAFGLGLVNGLNRVSEGQLKGFWFPSTNQDPSLLYGVIHLGFINAVPCAANLALPGSLKS
jgi:hypothetical protein